MVESAAVKSANRSVSRSSNKVSAKSALSRKLSQQRQQTGDAVAEYNVGGLTSKSSKSLKGVDNGKNH